MAHKSKTQRAKASVAKANKKDRQMRDEAAALEAASNQASEAAEPTRAEIRAAKAEEKKQAAAAAAKEKEAKPKKERFQFLKDVRAEMKRVTWPTRTDVIRWSGVVVGALVFFGVYVAVLDNLIITPALIALSGLGA